MSLFIATLGFGEGPMLDAAKTGILLASIIAGTIGFFILRGQKAGPEAG
jgi:NhaA family Na+:H+ antiporter